MYSNRPEMSTRIPYRLHIKSYWWILFSVLSLVGVIAFASAASGSLAQRAWQTYLTNLVFWTGTASGMVLFSAALVMANAGWGRALKRLAEAAVAFLPAAFILFCILYFGKNYVFPWIQKPSLAANKLWLTADFLFLRDGAAIIILAVLGGALVYFSVKRDVFFIAGDDVSGRQQQLTRLQSIISPIFGIAYGYLVSLLAFDLIMSLSPRWKSTLFGAYYFLGCFYSGLAGIMVLTALAARRMGLSEFVTGKQFHDLGKLILGFTILNAYFFYSQLVVIWYGNLPDETGFLITRGLLLPWMNLGWAVIVITIPVPFVILLSRRVKMIPSAMVFLSIIIMSGMWLEFYVLIAASLWPGPNIPFGLTEIFISLGFLGIAGLCLMLFLSRVPILPVSDPLFQKEYGIVAGKGQKRVRVING